MIYTNDPWIATQLGPLKGLGPSQVLPHLLTRVPLYKARTTVSPHTGARMKCNSHMETFWNLVCPSTFETLATHPLPTINILNFKSVKSHWVQCY